MAKRTTKKTPTADKSPEGASFEDSLERVETLIEQIESGEIGLEESLARYEEGVTLLRRCRSILDAAEQRVETLSDELEQRENGDGAA